MKVENQQAQFAKCFRKLVREGMLKAFLLALAIGFGVAFVVGSVTWIMGTNALWISLGAVLGIALIATPILYFSIFRPTVKSNAKRIDRMGLEERIITMVELNDQDDLFSRLQRADAQAHLAAFDEKQLKIRVPRKIVISTSVAAVLGCVMTTLSTLAALGIILSGSDLLDPIIPDPPVEYVYIEYIVDAGGYIDGAEFQEIIKGEDATPILAVAEEGWVFAGWDDGGKYPDRQDSSVMTDGIYIAIFLPAGGDGEGMPMPGDGAPADMGSDSPMDSDMKGDDGEKGKAGGKYEKANQVLDGQTYYRDVYDQYKDQADEDLSSDEGISEDMRDVIESYYEIIG